jgi:hypothetical protein
MFSRHLLSPSFSDAIQHVGVGRVMAVVFVPQIHLLPDVVAFFRANHLPVDCVLFSVVELFLRHRVCGFFAWKLRVGCAGVCDVGGGDTFARSTSSSSSSSRDVGSDGGSTTVTTRRLRVEVVEEAVLDTRRVRVVLVQERLVDQVLAEPLEGVFCTVESRMVSLSKVLGEGAGKAWAAPLSL